MQTDPGNEIFMGSAHREAYCYFGQIDTCENDVTLSGTTEDLSRTTLRKGYICSIPQDRFEAVITAAVIEAALLSIL